MMKPKWRNPFLAVLLCLFAGMTFADESFLDQFRSTVVLVERITGVDSMGVVKTFPHGTAFWVGDPSNPVLVSNRHVFEGQTELVLRLYNPTGDSSTLVLMPLVSQNGEALWHSHPDSKIDIAAISIENMMTSDIERIFIRTIQWSLFSTTESVNEGDRVFFLGYPLGLRTIGNPYALVRTGSVALKPSEDFLIAMDGDTLGQSIYLMDMISISGSSGSPVFIEPAVSSPYSGGGNTLSNRGTAFVGIVSGHVPSLDPVYVNMTSANGVAAGNSGLAIVFTAEDVRAVAELALSESN